MRVTFLVSALDRPHLLWGSLGSLIAQTDPSWEAVVLVNSRETVDSHLSVVKRIHDPRISLVCSAGPASNPVWGCYWSAEWAVENLRLSGEWICCASDDSYYCPEFIERMTFAGDGVADLVYCDLLYDKRHGGSRSVMFCGPSEGRIDKTNFMVRREKWIGFPHKRIPQGGGSNNADGLAVEAMVRRGYRVMKVSECLVIHN